MPLISISAVSHEQLHLITELLNDLQFHCKHYSIELIITINVNENVSIDLSAYNFPIRIIKNLKPMGFAENHNQAFVMARGEYFCVINPDIRLCSNPFPPLVKSLVDNDKIGVVAPVIINDSGVIEDSARRYPSPVSILSKLFKNFFKVRLNVRPVGDSRYDWVGGMFMLFNVHAYKAVNGFDDRYFLYYEDVDICARLVIMGKLVLYCRESTAIHLAQRASHKSITHFRWHIASMLRFFFSRVYWRVLWR